MWFDAVDTDKSGEITEQELSNMDWGNLKLSLVTARRLLNLFDRNKTGSVTFEEYIALHTFLSKAQQVFAMFDQDRSGFLNGIEVVNALSEGGFQVSPQTAEQLVRTYSRTNNGKLTLEEFINLKTLVATTQRVFEQFDFQHQGFIQLNHDTAVAFVSNLI